MATRTWEGADGTTPNDWSVAGNWEEGVVPAITDDVRIVGSADITAGLDQSAIALGDVIVEESFSGLIGSKDGYLQIDPNRFEFNGSGVAYIDLKSTFGGPVQIFKTASGGSGTYGLYIKGTGGGVWNIMGSSSVAVAGLHGDAATVLDLRVMGASADVYLGEGLTVTDVEIHGGTVEQRCGSNTLKLFDGQVTTLEEGAVSTLTQEGGIARLISTGTITTYNLNGGTADFLDSGTARTVTTLTMAPDSELAYDPLSLTITTLNLPTARPVRISLG